MKACKKCKKLVANKAKICKYCGADVSLCKIIKNEPNKKTSQNKNIEKKVVKVNEQVEIVTEKKKNDSKNNIKKDIDKKSLIKKVLKYKLFGKVNIFFIIVPLLIILSAYFLLFNEIDDKETNVFYVNSDHKEFNMGEVINYNDVYYKVLKVEISNGNNYKKPSKGNQFLIVTVSIENKTKDKVDYSYNNWTMSNSKSKEDAKRIFSSINVDDALYSGKLVVGGIKKGSMVFEQPINSEDIKLNFYEIKKDDNGSKVIDSNKKIFSVNIKVPENKDLDK